MYIVECNDGSLYTGVTTDLHRRLNEHNGYDDGRKARGAAYTRARRPVKLVYQENHPDRSAACRRECAVKRLSRQEKLLLVKVRL